MTLHELFHIVSDSIEALDGEKINPDNCEIIVSPSHISKVELRLNKEHTKARLIFYYKDY